MSNVTTRYELNLVKKLNSFALASEQEMNYLLNDANMLKYILSEAL